MSEWHAFRALLRAPRSDVAVLLTTFFLTVVFDLSLAVQVGVVLAALLFVKRMADLTKVGTPDGMTGARRVADGDGDLEALRQLGIPPGVQVYEIQGPFFFGAADKLRNTMPIFTRPPRVMILRLRHVPAIDATGLHALAEFHKECVARGTHLILAGVQPDVMRKVLHWPPSEAIGRENIVPEFGAGLERARVLLEPSPRGPQGGKKERRGKRVA
jgi:SulP family sulfate permease